MNSHHSLSAAEIAKIVSGTLSTPPPENQLSGINSLQEARPHEVSFLGNEQYRTDFFRTQAGLVLTTKDYLEAPSGVAIIHVENPTLSFAVLADTFRNKSQAMSHFISEQACCHEEFSPPLDVTIMAGAIIGAHVTLGSGSIIHSGAVIADHVTIGRNTTIYQNVTIREGCQIGSEVCIQPGAVIGADGFGYETVKGVHLKIPQLGIVIIEDHVEIGANSTIDRARFGKTIIGKGTKIDNLVQVAHNVSLGEHNIIVAQSGVAGSTHTGRNVVIGAQSGIAGHLTIGDKVLLAGQSGITKSIDTPGAYQGTPARPIRDHQKIKVWTNKLPKLNARIKALEIKLKKIKEKNSL